MREAGWLAGLLAFGAWTIVFAQDLHPPIDPVPLGEIRWLAPGAELGQIWRRPALALVRPLDDDAALGELLFRSPWIMGGMARRLGLSCDTCHSNGHRNVGFFFPGVSNKPGTFDPTNGVFNPAKDDGLFAPVDIPTLRGVVRRGGPFGSLLREPSLDKFLRSVIVDEFQGAEPTPGIRSALSAYLGRLGPSEAPDRPISLDDDLDALGRWVRLIGALIEKGEIDLAELALLSIRSEIGRLHERFAGEGLEVEREILEGMAMVLQDIGAKLEAKEAAEAVSGLERWLIAFEDFDRAWLLAAEPRTLYSKVSDVNTRRP